MRRINLSPEYTLPTNNDYDDVIDSMQRDVEEEGCVSYFLATIRSERKYSEAMHQRVVVPLTEQAFLYEDVNFNGAVPRTDLRIARGVLSGMMFGHIANEGLYPRMYDVDPYRNSVPINSHLLAEDKRVLYLEAMKTVDDRRTMMFRTGKQAMANLFLSGLSEQSIDRLVLWADEMVGEDRRHLFVNGFGTAMYLAWDAYSDIFQEAGREEEIHTFPALRAGIISGDGSK